MNERPSVHPAAVIFDCDGTLVDSEPLARRAWDERLARYGYTVREADYGGLLGLPYERSHAFFAERVPGLPPAGAFWAEYSGTLFALIDDELEPFDDALETVRELHERGVRVAVASSSPRARLDRTLRRAGLTDAFAVSVAGDEIANGKPAPDMFLAAAERLGVAPGDCVVIEDSPTRRRGGRGGRHADARGRADPGGGRGAGGGGSRGRPAHRGRRARGLS